MHRQVAVEAAMMLDTAQPLLSRRIRDLDYEVGNLAPGRPSFADSCRSTGRAA
jgi:hypothetical protein